MNSFYWIVLVIFLGSIIYNIVAVAQASGSSDAKNDMIKAITNVTIVNTILMLVMGGTAFVYISNDEAGGTFRNYMMFMVHVSLLISIISVSISSLQQLNAS